MAGIPVAQAVPRSDDSNVVLGVPIDDSSLRVQVRKVLGVAILMGILAVITGILSLVSTEDYSGGFIASFAIPVCGYVAIRNKSRSCLRAFVIWNGVCSVLFVVSAILISASTIPVIKCYCDLGCNSDIHSRTLPTGSARANSTEWRSYCDTQEGVIRAYYASLAVGAVTAFLQLLGCVWGKQLESNAYFAVSGQDIVPVGVVGLPYSVQPGAGGYPATGYAPYYAGYGPGGVPMATPYGHPGYGPSQRGPILTPDGQLNYAAMNAAGRPGQPMPMPGYGMPVGPQAGAYGPPPPGMGYPGPASAPYGQGMPYGAPYPASGSSASGGPGPTGATVAQPERPRCEPA